MTVRLSDNPIELFTEWYKEAQNIGLMEPSSVCLATVDADGSPSVRIVLLKAFDESGFVFYTNLKSRKGRDISSNNSVAMCFYWMPLKRQVRVEGIARLVSDEIADQYFQSRDRESKLGAWASIQSRTLEQSNDLKVRLDHYNLKFESMDVPRPDFWSGYIVEPYTIEFWQAGEHRLHNRRIYKRSKAEIEWVIEELYP
ncbi:MAG: pyridoxamine 5'-phosphate oxidase [Alphaproteobacteria bacterium]|nr:pyridoxamine 5'-phosphate oxidase [Alphaproteobacteria bacterium]